MENQAQSDGTPAVQLGYAGPDTYRASRLAEWLGRLPHWLIALGLILPLLAFHVFGWSTWFGRPNRTLSIWHLTTLFLFIAMFIPGALRRLNWRHLLFMVVLAGLAYALDEAFDRWGPGEPFPYTGLFSPFVSLLLLGLGEWIVIRPRSWTALAWTAVLAVAGACAALLTFYAFYLMTDPFGQWNFSNWAWPLYWFVLTFLAWTVIRAGLSFGLGQFRARQKAILVAASLSLASFILFFHILIHPIARHSLIHGGPFSRNQAILFLGHRGTSADQEMLWKTLENADWSQSVSGTGIAQDYRRIAMLTLAAVDRPATARRLSEMLRSKPSRELAGFCAPMLADERRYETVPLLMRYALLDQDACIDVLETMKVPQVAVAILRQETARFQSAGGIDFEMINSHDRQRLTSIFGKDAGPMLTDWATLTQTSVSQLPTPLDDELAWETERVIQCVRLHDRSSRILYDVRREMLARKLAADGNIHRLRLLESELRIGSNPNETKPRLSGALFSRDYVREILVATDVPEPDWNVRTTEELEVEIMRYTERVEAILEEQGIAPATSPTSMPPTDPQ